MPAIAEFIEEIRYDYYLLPHFGKKSALWFYFLQSPLHQHEEFGWVWGEGGGTKTRVSVWNCKLVFVHCN